jgi:hypothetical protein
MALEMLWMGLLSPPSLQVVLDKDVGGVMVFEHTLGLFELDLSLVVMDLLHLELNMPLELGQLDLNLLDM